MAVLLRHAYYTGRQVEMHTPVRTHRHWSSRCPGSHEGKLQKRELPSGWQAPFSTGFPCWVFQSPFVSVYQLALLWEAAFRFSEYFWRLFQHVCPFCDGWFTSIPAHIDLRVQQFLTKNSMTPVPHPPCSPTLASSQFFVCLFLRKKEVLKGKHFARCGRCEAKNGRSIKRHQNQWVQKSFEQ